MTKKSRFSVAFYLAGTAILITMSIFVVTNFKRDARVYQESLLAVVGNSQEKPEEDAQDNSQQDSYETIKYKKSSDQYKNTSAKKNTSAENDAQDKKAASSKKSNRGEEP